MNTMLWIHGFPLTSAVFEPQLTIPGVEHLRVDLPALESMDEYARFVVAELDRHKIEKATFAGLSMGGYVCFAAWRLFPERFSGLVLIDTRATADTEEARKGRYDSIAKIEKEGTKPIVDSMLPKMLTPAATPEMQAEVRGIMESWTPSRMIAALRAIAERPDSTPLLESIDVPTVVVAGDQDTITTVADATLMASKIPGAKLTVISGAAHLSNFEQPDQFQRAFA